MGCPPTFNFLSELLIILRSLCYGEGFYVLFFILLLISGFYCVLLYTYFNHGNSLYKFNINLETKLNDCLVLFSHSLLLIGFIFVLKYFL